MSAQTPGCGSTSDAEKRRRENAGEAHGAETLAEVLAAHYPRLLRCRCGEVIITRPLPDPGEREAVWAAHVAEVLAARIVQARAGEPWSACTGAGDCPEEWHEHGCYADKGQCSDPTDHHGYPEARAGEGALREELRVLRNRVSSVADAIHGDSGWEHNSGCEGEPDCFACIELDLRAALDTAGDPT